MKSTLFSILFLLSFSLFASAQTDSLSSNKMGTVTVAAFKAANEKGGKMVNAIVPTKTPMSSADQELFFKVMAGGQRQLGLSQALLSKLSDPKVKLLAASEIQEQTGIASKLQEVASAKGIQPPAAGPDSTITMMTRQLDSLSGTSADHFYLEQSGIKGHELLLQTMTLVNSTAKDDVLKKLATATLPVIRMHLSVSKELNSSMPAGNSGTPAK